MSWPVIEEGEKAEGNVLNSNHEGFFFLAGGKTKANGRSRRTVRNCDNKVIYAED